MEIEELINAKKDEEEEEKKKAKNNEDEKKAKPTEECEEEPKKADDSTIKRLDALEKKVMDLEKKLAGMEKAKEKYPLPSKYPYAKEEKKSMTNDAEEWMNVITKSIDDISSRIDSTGVVDELKKSIDERDAKIKELSDRLEKVESVKLKKSVVESEVLVGRPSLIIKNGEVYKE